MDSKIYEGLVVGIGLGFGCSAGVAGESEGMDHRQIGAMLEILSESRETIKTLANMAIEDSMRGGPRPKDYQAALSMLMRRARPQ